MGENQSKIGGPHGNAETQGAGSGGKSTTSSSAETSRTAGRGNETGDSQQGSSQGNPRLVAVEVPGGETEAPVKRGPGRPRKDGNIPQPKKPTEKKAQAKSDGMLESNIAAFIKTTFDIAALKVGPLWVLSPEEAQAIAAPAARILERSGAGAVTSKYSDYFLLLFALSGTLIPRVMAAQAAKPQENKSMEVLKGGAKQNPQKPSAGPGGRTPDRSAPISANPISQSMPGLAL